MKQKFLFKMINKIEKTPASLKNKKKKKRQDRNYYYQVETEAQTTEFAHSKRIIIEYSE